MIVINIKENWTKFYTLTSESDGDEYQQQTKTTEAEDQQKLRSSSSTDTDTFSSCSKRKHEETANSLNNNSGNCRTNPEDSAYTLVKCTSCDKFVGVTCRLEDEPESLTFAEILDDPSKTIDGWTKAEGEKARRALYVLSQLIYKKYEPPEESQLEVEFALPPSTDLVKLLWINGVASGFFSVKLKGTLDPDRKETYSMSTLDTIFIRKAHRRQGHASAALEDILTEFPDQNIGFSYPISFSMEKVLSKHLLRGPQNRLRFWEISGCGTQGNCRNLWLNLQRSSRKKRSPPAHQTEHEQE